MSRRLNPVCAFLLVSVLAGVPATHAMRQAPSPSPAPALPDLVPVNVHVVDRAGKPVTDLKQTSR